MIKRVQTLKKIKRILDDKAEAQARLDEMVHQAFDAKACAVCNEGWDDQVRFLEDNGDQLEQILEDLELA